MQWCYKNLHDEFEIMLMLSMLLLLLRVGGGVFFRAAAAAVFFRKCQLRELSKMTFRNK